MGVETKVTKPGDGKNFPKAGDTITMHYEGRLENGDVFDSSYARNKPFTSKIGVGQLIAGWDEAVPKMSVGEKATLTISSDYGYGARGVPGLIPGGATLVFDVELIKIN
ncbi:FK506 binding protein proline rotamase rapamycin-binding protein [Coemansia sp. RSA 2671]|uniref:peptidylprolyl isomerase n=2 Tax=Coemansia TaxID=4863 RepID=A0A9W8L3V0_9FUNG|nr:FK506 binding protein proline rotamase rapamycin-binding protein [Coemansia sp. RSA 2675]KAJ1997949.1 FK506 binding protein proline rotamase rapamycin-binding protein [Coemansia sp. S85]KAJ2023368.1 FK506 binding protein proline rotamase rapamycin-binding protein [Coemansia sp. S610]KAJ2349334.1 FK506 binding protein proline rotamase rapamycin-binding protein [Coemansia sp. RSA 2671]KAJ2384206.1 FK506 binding protein proline rotamase rapamycin-binding protein [Coemansia sp. RSA 2611]KAJ2688